MKMSSIHALLGGALAVQLMLGGLTWSMAGGGAARSDARKLVDVGLGDITELIVQDKPADKESEPETVHLKKEGDAWTVVSADAFPADTTKVEDVLRKLLDLKVSDPIARKTQNHNALRVGERDYDKKVTVTAGGTTHHLVLGSAKGSSVHVRVGDAPEVYWAKGVSSWSFSERVSSYVDSDYLKVDEPKAVSIQNQHGSLEVVKGEDDLWTLRGLAAGEKAKASEIQTLVDKAKSIRLSEVVGKQETDEMALGTGATVVITAADDTKHTLRLGSEKDGKVYAKAAGKDHVVLVGKWAIEKLLEAKSGDLVEGPSS